MSPVAPRNRTLDAWACALLLAVFFGLTQFGDYWFSAAATARKAYPDALMWIGQPNDVTAACMMLALATAVTTYFLLPGSSRPRHLLLKSLAVAAALGCASMWAAAHAGVVVTRGEAVFRTPMPWTHDSRARLSDAREVLSGCVAGRAQRGSDPFVLYIMTLRDGREIRFSDAGSHPPQAAHWLADMRALAPWLEAPGVAHVRHHDGPHAYLDMSCLSAYRAQLSDDDLQQLLALLHATRAELSNAVAAHN